MKTEKPVPQWKQKTGSRFIRVIPAPEYAQWMYSEQASHKFDKQGRRIK